MTQARPSATIRQVVSEYMAHMNPTWMSLPRGEDNVRGYRLAAEAMCGYFGDMTLREVCNEDDLRTHCMRYPSTRGRANNTIRRELGLLRAALKWAWDKRWISGFPLMWMPPEGEARERRLSDEEVAKLLDAASSYPTRHHVKTFFYLALHTSATVHAIRSLRWSQVDFTRRTITFDGRGDQRFYKAEMTDALETVLKEAKLASPHGCKHVLQWRGKPVKNVRTGLLAVVRRAGLKDITSNDLRRWRQLDDTPEPEERESEDEYIVISYATSDALTKAAALCEELEAAGYSCWFAERDMQGGPYSGHIMDAIHDCLAFVPLVTAGANASDHVPAETDAAFKRKRLILPVIVAKTEPAPRIAYYINDRHQTPWTSTTEVAKALIKLLPSKPSHRQSA